MPTRVGQSPELVSRGTATRATDWVALATGEAARSVGDLLGGDDGVAIERLQRRLAVAGASTTPSTARGCAATAAGSHGVRRGERGRGERGSFDGVRADALAKWESQRRQRARGTDERLYMHSSLDI